MKAGGITRRPQLLPHPEHAPGLDGDCRQLPPQNWVRLGEIMQYDTSRYEIPSGAKAGNRRGREVLHYSTNRIIPLLLQVMRGFRQYTSRQRFMRFQFRVAVENNRGASGGWGNKIV